MMAKKKDDKDQLSADELLEARVDAMMDTRPEAKTEAEKSTDKTAVPAPDQAAAHTEPDQTVENLPPLDIFTDSKGAPALPTKLKAASAKDTEAKSTAEEIKPTDEAKPAADSVAAPIDIELDDPRSDAAVDDIVAQEGDVVLAAEDAGVARANAAAQAARPQPTNHRHPIFWFFITLLVIVAAIFVIDLVNPNLLNV